MNRKIDRGPIFKMFEKGKTITEIHDETGVSRAAIANMRKEWKNGIPCTVKKEKRSSVKHTFDLELVGLTIYGGHEVYRIVEDQVYGFEDVFIVKCPGTMERYDKNVFGDIAWTFNMLLELGSI